MSATRAELLERLLDPEQVVMADGAMGTELYARGVFINQCYDELNVRQRLALALALEKGEFQVQDLEAECPGVHRRSLQRDLRSLIEKGLLEARGGTNRLVYRPTARP